MRINKFVAQATGLSRRAADTAIDHGLVRVNDHYPSAGQDVTADDVVLYEGKPITLRTTNTTILFHKPVGVICSRDGQGGQTIYDVLPEQYHKLKPVGRLDKHTSGLLLLTDDGQLAYTLTHPSQKKEKRYIVKLDKDLSEADFETITRTGVKLEDGPSKLGLDSVNNKKTEWRITMHEGRNRQIRRTFEALGYHVYTLHRTHFGEYDLADLPAGQLITV
jgi:23S rRNA pseudouridine2605 synthase